MENKTNDGLLWTVEDVLLEIVSNNVNEQAEERQNDAMCKELTGMFQEENQGEKMKKDKQII